jgi:hypothetical protein
LGPKKIGDGDDKNADEDEVVTVKLPSMN